MSEIQETTSSLGSRLVDYKFRGGMWEFVKSIINTSYDMDPEMLKRLQSKKLQTEAILDTKLLPAANDHMFLPEPKKQLSAASDEKLEQLKTGTNG